MNEFSKAVVQHLAATIPSRFVAKSGGGNRIGKIVVDYLRNGHGATVAAEVILTPCAEVIVTHLGEDDGLCGAVDVDPGGSSGDTSDGPKG